MALYALQKVKYISGAAQLSEELRAAGPRLVVVNFTAKWCGPCKTIAPAIDALSDKYTDVVFLKVVWVPLRWLRAGVLGCGRGYVVTCHVAVAVPGVTWPYRRVLACRWMRQTTRT